MSLILFFQVSFALEKINLEDKCNGGDMHSCYFLGLEYKKLKKHQKANDYFQLACDNNVSMGCFSLGVFYHMKRKKYALISFKYYTKACNLNNSYACNNLGNLYRYGKGVEQNFTKAIQLYEKSYCLYSREKPLRNRNTVLESIKSSTFKSNMIDCILLQFDESMDTVILHNSEAE